MIKQILTAISLVLLIAGCSILGLRKPPVQEVKGDNVVCFLYKTGTFKSDVVKNVTQFLTGKDLRIVTDIVKNAKYYNATDYGAVIYMAEYWAWHTPWHTKKYFNINKGSDNIIFVITSGDPDVTIKKPFDAVTSASKPDRVEPVSQEIIERLDHIVRF